MEQMLNELFEAEQNAKKKVERCKEERRGLEAVCASELEKLRAEEFEKAKLMLEKEQQESKLKLEKELAELDRQHEAEKALDEKYGEKADEAVKGLFERIIRL